MEEFRTTWKNSIFSRLIITFLIIIIPIYGLGIGIYNWALQAVRQELSNTMLSQVNFYLRNLEDEVQRIKTLQYYCLEDENLKQLSGVPESLSQYEKTRSIQEIQQRLLAMANSSTYISEASAYIPAIDRTISSSTFETSINMDEFSRLAYQSNDNGAQLIFWDKSLFLSSVYPLQVNNYVSENRIKPYYIVGVEIGMDRLQNSLEQFSDYKDSGALMVDLKGNYVLTSSSNIDTNKQIESLVKEKLKTAKSGTKAVKIGEKSFLVIFTTSDFLNIALSKYIPESEIFSQLKKYSYWFWIFTAAALVIISLYSIFMYRLLHRPMVKLVKSFRKVEQGDFSYSIVHKHNDEFRYLYARFNEMVEKLNTLIDQVYRQKILMQNARLKQLQSQINPHFLYNSYFILHRMVKMEDYENAVLFSKHLGTYLKFITRSAADEVPLSKEVEHARIYADIQSMRFSSRIEIEFGALPEGCEEIMVPRLIIQPVIENAFEHGLEGKAQGGMLKIAFLNTLTEVKVIIEDNGNGLSEEEMERLKMFPDDRENADNIENTGIINIHRRLILKYGSESGLYLSKSELGGLKVEINIVYGKGNNDVQTANC